ncbi:MAG TPA: response regulator [Segetibacter sp.]|nr:response regulator [Segetibacter sp.]
MKILLVEDNEGDILLTRKAFEIAGVDDEIEVVKDGEKAVQFLKKEGNYQDVETPQLILLDINLPKLNGKEVLSVIKNDLQLKTIPVIMLTTSNAQSDIVESYTHHANCYITKPDNFNDFVDVVESIKHFWSGIVKLPITMDLEKTN